ncbi:hypothetical protein ACFVYD_35145 [Streptomyces sp. NPDC058301]|uniref:hypothetical protein n=1 Tax=Streptomyces sp. NPDC058301 TaxID=3346436 RepID=UPI0036E1CF5C
MADANIRQLDSEPSARAPDLVQEPVEKVPQVGLSTEGEVLPTRPHQSAPDRTRPDRDRALLDELLDGLIWLARGVAALLGSLAGVVIERVEPGMADPQEAPGRYRPEA